jgi:hypothetical protein
MVKEMIDGLIVHSTAKCLVFVELLKENFYCGLSFLIGDSKESTENKIRCEQKVTRLSKLTLCMATVT